MKTLTEEKVVEAVKINSKATGNPLHTRNAINKKERIIIVLLGAKVIAITVQNLKFRNVVSFTLKILVLFIIQKYLICQKFVLKTFDTNESVSMSRS